MAKIKAGLRSRSNFLDFNSLKVEIDSKANVGHTHSSDEISGLDVNASSISIADTSNVIEAANVEDALSEIAKKYNSVDGKLAGKADVRHTHNSDEISGLVIKASTIPVEDKSNKLTAANVEDALGEIVTKCETIDGKLAGKADVKHTHSSEDLNGLEIKASTVPVEDKSDKLTATNVEDALGEIVTKCETIDGKLAGKADVNHTHSSEDLHGLEIKASTVPVEDSESLLEATNVEGALSEVVKKCNNIDGKLAGKANVKHTHSSEDLEGFTVKAADITIADSSNVVEANNVEGALGEIATKCNANKTNIGTLANLATTNKDNIVSAVNELFQNVSNGKSSIATAITDKGVPTSDSDSFQTMATNISNIPTSSMPEGWDTEKVGKVIESDISEGDAILWEQSNFFDGNVVRSESTLPDSFDPEHIRDVAFSGNGRHLAIAYKDQPYIFVYKYNNGQFTKLPNLPAGLVDADQSDTVVLRFSPSGEYLFAYSNFRYDTRLYRVNGDEFTKCSIPLLGPTSGRIFEAQFSNTIDTRCYLTTVGNGDEYNKVYEINGTNATVLNSQPHFTGGESRACGFTSDSKYVVFAGYAPGADGMLFDVRSRTYSYLNSGLPAVAYCMAFSSNNYIAYAKRDNNLELFKYDTGSSSFTKVSTVTAKSSISKMVFSHCGNFLLCKQQDNKIICYKIISDTLTPIDSIFGGEDGYARNFDTSKEGTYIILDATLYETPAEDCVRPFDWQRFTSAQNDCYCGFAKESKSLGEQIKANVFTKFSI